MDLKAIPTNYANCNFRSRLEARWAVFFDELGLEWIYEPQGYAFRGLRYLCDFYLPTLELWVEVKGMAPTPADRLKCKRMAEGSEKRLALLVGSIPEDSSDDCLSVTMFWPDGDSAVAFWGKCQRCGRIDMFIARRCSCAENDTASDSTDTGTAKLLLGSIRGAGAQLLLDTDDSVLVGFPERTPDDQKRSITDVVHRFQNEFRSLLRAEEWSVDPDAEAILDAYGMARGARFEQYAEEVPF